jgi:transposase
MAEVVIGVDAHKRTHTLVAVNSNGRKLAEKTIPTTTAGNQAAMRWARARFGSGLLWGIEDCRSMTARLEHDLLATDAKVVRVPPHLMSRSRASSRAPGKSDPIDALAVARAVLREPDLPVAFHDPVSLELRLLVDRRDDLVLHRVATINRLLARVHQLDPTHSHSSNWHWAKTRETMREWLIPHTGLTAELARDEIAEIITASEAVDRLSRRIGGLIRGVAPSLLALQGCGELTAAKIVAETAGVHRFKSEAAFARLAGVAPVPHWSGDVNVRVRPTRRGNRQLNTALHRIAVTQIRWDGPGKVYFEKRLHDGDTRSQALRSLKRRLARVVFNRLRTDQPHPASAPTAIPTASAMP